MKLLPVLAVVAFELTIYGRLDFSRDGQWGSWPLIVYRGPTEFQRWRSRRERFVLLTLVQIAARDMRCSLVVLLFFLGGSSWWTILAGNQLSCIVGN